MRESLPKTICLSSLFDTGPIHSPDSDISKFALAFAFAKSAQTRFPPALKYANNALFDWLLLWWANLGQGFTLYFGLGREPLLPEPSLTS